MCGITGFFGATAGTSDSMSADLRRMADAIRHRGPDDDGVWCDPAAGIGLAHRRLSIVDLSPTGHQPMTSASGRYVIVFNGEIYNYLDLRAELSSLGCHFKGTSDTEVLLAGIETWGFERTLDRCIGMLALALWDSQERTLRLARDRFGEKPLYVAQYGSLLLFGSELSALRAHPQWRGQIDRGALASLMRNDFIPAPFSIFQEVIKVRPGCAVTVKLAAGRLELKEAPYFDLRAVAGECLSSPFAGSAEEAVEELQRVMQASIARQMVADVPVGAFLSGGVDSSLVVAMMQQQSRQPVRTFSIGFSEKEYDESAYARDMARRLGTQHTEYEVTPRDALDVIPKLPTIYDEPFADSSQIPTYLVSALARRHVTVSLSGDAGDELFGGYGRYPDLVQRWNRRGSPGQRLKQLAAGLINSTPAGLLALAGWAGAVVPRWRAPGSVSDQLRELSMRWSSASPGELYASMRSLTQRPSELVLGANEHRTAMSDWSSFFRGDDLMRSMMILDACFYLPEDILAKVDRAAMAVSLETRVPFLDTGVARFAWSVPTGIHFHDGRGKWLLRRLLQKFVPPEAFERRKQGFAVPVARWLRQDLRGWAEDLLDPVRLKEQGIFNTGAVQRRWLQHQSGTVDWSANLWGILMFQAWARQWRI